MWISHSDSEVCICVILFIFPDCVTVVFNAYSPTHHQWYQYQLQQFGSDAHCGPYRSFSAYKEYMSESPENSDLPFFGGRPLVEYHNANEKRTDKFCFIRIINRLLWQRCYKWLKNKQYAKRKYLQHIYFFTTYIF